ncbi:MAG TPA: hypothetical protein VGM90_12620 [Kofleriaceae bacterium]|jgi:hypothetical protein
MRIAGFFLCIVLASAGCKSKDGGAAGSGAPDPAALKAQEALINQRNQMQDEYKDLVAKNEKLDLQINDVTAKGGDATELKKQKEQLESQIAEKKGSIESQSGEIDKMSATLSSKLDDAGKMAQREKSLADREKALAEREHDLTDQVMKFAQVQKDSAVAWQATCQSGGTIIQQVAAPKNGNYSRKEVDGLMAKAKGAMSKKGLVASDLGPQATLEGEVTKAMNDEDWGRAGVLASQYAATVDAIQVNRLFIQGKIARLQARAKSGKLDDATNAQLASAMNEISRFYGDGDFANANRRINQVFAVLK